jgi:hypothetical protein
MAGVGDLRVKPLSELRIKRIKGFHGSRATNPGICLKYFIDEAYTGRPEDESSGYKMEGLRLGVGRNIRLKMSHGWLASCSRGVHVVMIKV